jgi:hypothetical protein
MFFLHGSEILNSNFTLEFYFLFDFSFSFFVCSLCLWSSLRLFVLFLLTEHFCITQRPLATRCRRFILALSLFFLFFSNFPTHSNLRVHECIVPITVLRLFFYCLYALFLYFKIQNCFLAQTEEASRENSSERQKTRF